MLLTVVVFDEDVLSLICRCALHSGGRFEERQSFYNVLKGDCGMHSAGELVMCLGDFIGHVGRHIDAVHGGNGIGQRNLE